ncbi:hypothetical protein C4J65_21850 [Streptomyces sp. CB09001]|nr:hypothetical protein C4J65_21850 [Streptomyces sp. CB09001]
MRGTSIAPMGVAMTTSAAGQPLIPQPPATVAALRQAVRQITPAALPAFTRRDRGTAPRGPVRRPGSGRRRPARRP